MKYEENKIEKEKTIEQILQDELQLGDVSINCDWDSPAHDTCGISDYRVTQELEKLVSANRTLASIISRLLIKMKLSDQEILDVVFDPIMNAKARQ